MEKPHVVRQESELLMLLNPEFGFHLLRQFVEPATASEAARRLDESASKVSYHVGKWQELGLLVPVMGAAGRGQKLQVVAEKFVLDPALFPVLSNETLRPMVAALVDAFWAASPTLDPDPAQEYVLTDFTQDDPASAVQAWETGQRGLTVQQFRLTRERYAALMTELHERVRQEAKASESEGQAAGKWHTVALLAFPGTLLPMAESSAK